MRIEVKKISGGPLTTDDTLIIQEAIRETTKTDLEKNPYTSHTKPVRTIKKGDLIIIKGNPCKVTDVAIPK